MRSRLKISAIALSAFGLAAVCLPAFFSARAEILPVKTYTAADGLPRDAVRQTRQDARGFIWFCTSEGLVRFDGYGFKLYGKEDGLPTPSVLDLLETRGGLYLLATSAGLVRFNPNGARGSARSGGKNTPMFATYLPGAAPEVTAALPSNAPDRYLVEALYEDAHGVVWIGTRYDGLFRLEVRDGQLALQPVELNPRKKPRVVALAKDQRGYLWAGAYVGMGDGELYRLSPQGQVEHFTNPGWRIHALLEDTKGRLWAGVGAVKDGVLCQIEENPAANRSVFSRCYGTKDGLPAAWVRTLVQTTDGATWAGTTKGAAIFDPDAPAGRPLFQLYQGRQGICDQDVWRISEDRAGALWMSSTWKAESRLSRYKDGRFKIFTPADGLPASEAILEWLATPADGVGKIDDPTVEPLRITWYNRANGLSSNYITSLVEDGWGRICRCACGTTGAALSNRNRSQGKTAAMGC